MVSVVKENLIGCCGIYCGACPFYRGEITELSRRLKEAIKEEKFDKIAIPFEWVGSYREFKKWVNFLARAKCEGCQAGGGNPFCSIRKCCQRKEIKSCAECIDLPCKKLDWTSERYRKWNIKNLKRIKEVGYERWLKEKKVEVKEGFKTGLIIKGIKRDKRNSSKVDPK
jgi:hypothetical protein